LIGRAHGGGGGLGGGDRLESRERFAQFIGRELVAHPLELTAQIVRERHAGGAQHRLDTGVLFAHLPRSE